MQSISSALDRLRELISEVHSALDVDDVVAVTLDQLIAAVGAARGKLLNIGGDGTPVPVHARSRAHRLPAADFARISRTTVQQVLETGELVFADAGDSGAESFALFGIASAMAGPIRRAAAAAGPERGALPALCPVPGSLRAVAYVDYASGEARPGPAARELFRVACDLIGLVLSQHERLQSAHQRALGAVPIAAPPGTPALQDLLAPASMAQVRRAILPVLHTNAPILLLAESGTGKTLFARSLAAASGKLPFVRVNLGQGDDRNTVRSELFGHVRGAYTGSAKDRRGKVELAAGGTVFFDELLNFPAWVQPLLLDFLQEGTFEPLGWEHPEPKRAVARVLAGINGDVAAAIRDGRLRQDLYYRLAGAVVELPPLRARREDIPALSEAFLRRLYGDRTWALSARLRTWLSLEDHSWPGNFRTLQYMLMRAAAQALMADAESSVLIPEHCEPFLQESESAAGAPGDGGALAQAAAAAALVAAAAATTTEADPLAVDPEDLAGSFARLHRLQARAQAAEKELIELALRRHAGIVVRAADALGMPRNGITSRMRKHRISNTWRHLSTNRDSK
ncbi:MAG: sigma 54-interacting transcriptional regulator [Candidatus Schekmanbacteria bacterium]|nr:sigma 54-interacting transcriptional regulator [Candidatus Schekmanbacteria bacterium]